MTLEMIGQLLGDTRREFKGPRPQAKPFPGQIPTPESNSEDFSPDVMPGYKPLPGPATDMEITQATGDVHPYAPAGPAAALAQRKTR